MKIQALTPINLCTQPITTAIIWPQVSAGDILEVSNSIVVENGYTWRNILNTPYWVTVQLNEPLTRYFDVLESEPEPIPEPQDCKLSLELEGFTLDSGALIWDSQTIVKAELDNGVLEMAVICYETDNAYCFWIRGEGMDTLEIVMD